MSQIRGCGEITGRQTVSMMTCGRFVVLAGALASSARATSRVSVVTLREQGNPGGGYHVSDCMWGMAGGESGPESRIRLRSRLRLEPLRVTIERGQRRRSPGSGTAPGVTLRSSTSIRQRMRRQPNSRLNREVSSNFACAFGLERARSQCCNYSCTRFTGYPGGLR
jgi:hypothetical protein